MVRVKVGSAAQQIDALWASGTLTGMSDAQLLARFSETRDSRGESAFRELINRHGAMVMGVCRRVLRTPDDADDAFQATFLVLVRKAGSVRVHESLGPWLHSVAYRTAQRARARASRYRQADWEPADDSPAQEEQSFQIDLRPLLQEELGRLPDKYRAPIVLCHLEGKSHEEAARLLDWPVGTVSGRLSRGRQLLKTRLERRGLAASSVLLPGPWLELASPVSVALVETTTAHAMRFAASQAVPVSILALTHGVLRAMLLTNMKTVLLAVVVLTAMAGGAGAGAYFASGPERSPRPADKSAPPATASSAVNPGALPPGQLIPFEARPLPNSPNLADPRDPIPVFGAGSKLLVQSKDGKEMMATSVDSAAPGWHRLSVPAGIKAVPLASMDVLALAYSGQNIAELAAFSDAKGDWSTVKLLKPVNGSISPTIGHNCALYQSGNDFYAFSGDKGDWDTLHLPADGSQRARAQINPKYITVQHGPLLYVFSIKHAKWAQGVDTGLPAAPSKPGKEASKPAQAK